MITATHVCKRFGNIEAVKDVSVTVKKGEVFGLIGTNGAGKSTLLKSIANLLEYKGSVKLDSKEISKLNRKDLAKNVALMTQASNIYFPYTVYETVALGRYAHLKGVFSRINKEDDEIILKSIANVGLIDIKDKLISELSGGQLQRVYLARAFAQDPDVILLDEPMVGLDPMAIKELKAVITELRDQGVTILISTHMLEMVKHGKILEIQFTKFVLNMVLM